MKASDVMTLGAASTTVDASLADAIRCMGDHRISALPVLDGEGHLRGIVSEGDFFRRDGGALRLDALVEADSAERARLLGSREVSDIERISTGMNRQGFPTIAFCDSYSVLVKEAGMDGSPAFDGFALAAFVSDR